MNSSTILTTASHPADVRNEASQAHRVQVRLQGGGHRPRGHHERGEDGPGTRPHHLVPVPAGHLRAEQQG